VDETQIHADNLALSASIGVHLRPKSSLVCEEFWVSKILVRFNALAVLAGGFNHSTSWLPPPTRSQSVGLRSEVN
jgi:hypothetical protein